MKSACYSKQPFLLRRKIKRPACAKSPFFFFDEKRQPVPESEPDADKGASIIAIDHTRYPPPGSEEGPFATSNLKPAPVVFQAIQTPSLPRLFPPPPRSCFWSAPQPFCERANLFFSSDQAFVNLAFRKPAGPKVLHCTPSVPPFGSGRMHVL